MDLFGLERTVWLDDFRLFHPTTAWETTAFAMCCVLWQKICNVLHERNIDGELFMSFVCCVGCALRNIAHENPDV